MMSKVDKAKAQAKADKTTATSEKAERKRKAKADKAKTKGKPSVEAKKACECDAIRAFLLELNALGPKDKMLDSIKGIVGGNQASAKQNQHLKNAMKEIVAANL